MAVLSQTCGWKWRMVQLHMHIFPSIYPSSNLLYGNLWAKGRTFLNGPWWIFPSVNLLSWTYVHSLLPLCNMWCDGKKTSFLLLLDSFLASLHPSLCCARSCALSPSLYLPILPVSLKIPTCLVWPSHSQLGKSSLITDFGQKTFLREHGAAPRVGLASCATGLGVWSYSSFVWASRVG